MKELFEIQQRLVSNKSNYNEFGKFSYRSLENILSDVKPLLQELKCTITFNDDMIMLGDRYYVKSQVFLENENGEVKQATAYAREDENRAGMSQSQVTGTASSYARKYAICSLLAINEEQDVDSMDHSKSYTKVETNVNKQENLLQQLTDNCATAKGKYDYQELTKFFKYWKNVIEKGEYKANNFNFEKHITNWFSKKK